jgi:hypothetical protein
VSEKVAPLVLDSYVLPFHANVLANLWLFDAKSVLESIDVLVLRMFFSELNLISSCRFHSNRRSLVGVKLEA